MFTVVVLAANILTEDVFRVYFSNRIAAEIF